MSEKLAINGGKPAIGQEIKNRLPAWPPIFDGVPEILEQIYRSRKWSFNQIYEQRFSQAFASHHSAKFGIFMVNGTVTLECALKAVGVGKGDEVIIPGLTWMATAMAAVYVGAKPVFVDIEPDTLCLDPTKVEKAITKKTKAIIPVHIYGSMADMEAMMDIADKHGISVIEDCAHAHGGIWNGKGVGSIGHVGSFSFQESKTLTSGEGGACITNDETLNEKIFRLKHIGYDLSAKQGQARSGPPEGLICHNYRGTEFQAAILLESLKHLQQQTELRDKNANYLREMLADLDGVRVQPRGRLADLQGYYMLVLLFDLSKFNNIPLNRLIEIFQAEGLGIGGTYGPVYKHDLWSVPSNMYAMADGGCPVCDDSCDNIATTMGHRWLMTDKETMETIASAIKKVVKSGKELV